MEKGKIQGKWAKDEHDDVLGRQKLADDPTRLVADYWDAVTKLGREETKPTKE